MTSKSIPFNIAKHENRKKEYYKNRKTAVEKENWRKEINSKVRN